LFQRQPSFSRISDVRVRTPLTDNFSAHVSVVDYCHCAAAAASDFFTFSISHHLITRLFPHRCTRIEFTKRHRAIARRMKLQFAILMSFNLFRALTSSSSEIASMERCDVGDYFIPCRTNFTTVRSEKSTKSIIFLVFNTLSIIAVRFNSCSSLLKSDLMDVH
jgi:hypothetical protein